MFQTMIVDDDFLVRSYLKQLNSWEAAGFQIMADVRDGEEALSIMEQKKPDLIVTDISMPLMDGIELIRRVKLEYPNIYIIVLSCHEEFEYVKEAMKLGADEYMLKNSLDEDSLYKILKNASHHMQGQKEKYSKDEQTKKLIRLGSHSLKFHYFNQILSGTIADQEKEEKCLEAGIKGKYQNSAVINMFVPKWNEIKNQKSDLELEQYHQLFLHKLEQALYIIAQEEGIYVESIYLGEGIFCCFLDLSGMNRSSLMRQKLTSVATACFRYAQKEPYSYAIGVSNICFGEDGIRQAYQQAREMVKLSFYDKGEILYFDLNRKISTELPNSACGFLEYSKEMVQGKKQEEFEQAFEQVALDCEKNHVEPKVLLHWLKELDIRTGNKVLQEKSIADMEDFRKAGADFSKKYFSYGGKILPPGISKQVEQSVLYIREHFKESMGLAEAAGAVGLNPTYLSYLFKQEMGIGFSNYLLELRMDCARDLLKDTAIKIKDVAAKSGFNDYHYFSKAFKKLNGSSPADYRKQ